MSTNLLKNMPLSRKIAYLGTFTAIAMLVDMLFYRVNLFGQNITFVPVVIFYVSCWLGLSGGAIVAVIADFISNLIWGRIGQYNPFFTLSAFFLGIIPALIMLFSFKSKGGIFIKIILSFLLMYISSVLFENIIGMYFYYKVYLKGNMSGFFLKFWLRIGTNTVVYSINFIVAILLFYPLNKIPFLRLN